MKKKKTNHIEQEGFSTPINYFNKNKEVILNNLNLKKSDSKNDDLGFVIPNQYHKTFTEELLQSITHKEANKISSHNIFKNYYLYALAIAASFLLFFVISKEVYSTKKNTPIVTTITDTIKEVKTQLPKAFSIIEENEELFAIYVDDNFSDELIEEFATEDLIFSN